MARELQWIKEHHHEINPWFSPQQIDFALSYWARHLNPVSLEKLTSMHAHRSLPTRPLNILVIAAGNIPMAGFHDLISVYLSGHHFFGSFSAKDNRILPLLIRVLHSLDPSSRHQILLQHPYPFTPDRVISSGSNNTARFIEYTYRQIPQLVRKNRSSLAILMGGETDADLKKLAADMTIYYGLGCRSVSKIYLQEVKQLNPLARVLSDHNSLLNNPSYQNNVTFQKARYQLHHIAFLETGPLLFVENTAINSPVSVIHYESFSDIRNLVNRLSLNRDEIQCMVSRQSLVPGSVEFGKAQDPELWDYADEEDTLQFLLQ